MTRATHIDKQLSEATAVFESQFGRKPTVAVAAPGRVNLIGGHTDYNDGFVLPLALEKQTIIVADRAAGRTVRFCSANLQAEATFDLPADGTDATVEGDACPAWANYARGVLHGYLKRGIDTGGFDAVIHSTVPVGGGLSSSAALEVAVATLAEAIAGETIDPVEKALLCQWAEHEYAHMPCGIMDQFISVFAERGRAMLLDCRTHERRLVPLDDPEISVLIINSNVKHELTGSEYPERRAQCETAAATLGVAKLRDATVEQLNEHKTELDDVVFRRALHVVTENARTLEAADALVAGDWARCGELMYQSHQSANDNFEITTDEINLLVDLARQIATQMPSADEPPIYGSRLTGGGFGGCTVSLVRTSALDDLTEYFSGHYQKETGKQPTIFATRPGAGARVLTL